MDPQDYTDVMSQLKALQLREKKLKDEGQVIQSSIREAIQEAIRVIAMTIINERRAEIEAACNFDGLREAVASELVRQFMTARLMGQATPFDKAQNKAPSYPSGPYQSSQLQGSGGSSAGSGLLAAVQGFSKP